MSHYKSRLISMKIEKYCNIILLIFSMYSLNTFIFVILGSVIDGRTTLAPNIDVYFHKLAQVTNRSTRKFYHLYRYFSILSKFKPYQLVDTFLILLPISGAYEGRHKDNHLMKSALIRGFSERVFD